MGEVRLSFTGVSTPTDYDVREMVKDRFGNLEVLGWIIEYQEQRLEQPAIGGDALWRPCGVTVLVDAVGCSLTEARSGEHQTGFSILQFQTRLSFRQVAWHVLAFFSRQKKVFCFFCVFIASFSRIFKTVSLFVAY